MEEFNVYKDIEKRTNGEIYIGVVGPVRSGKSTFIKKFMDTVVIPNIPDGSQRDRAIDELPQSSSGRTIMTTEPKFIPENAVSVKLDGEAEFKVRMIDCVGYIVPSSLGYIEEDQPRMVKTPWFEEDIPFDMAAEIGTKKVITEHSTIGLVITTDGSISEIPREEYEEAEERVTKELDATGRPYVMLLNCVEPGTKEAKALANNLSQKYEVPVIPINCLDVSEEDVKGIIGNLLYEFPVREVELKLPGWVTSLDSSHWLFSSVLESVRSSYDITKMREVKPMLESLKKCDYIKSIAVENINLGNGKSIADVGVDHNLFYKILSEQTNLEIASESEILEKLIEMAAVKKKFQKLEQAYEDVMNTGYGIVLPETEELSLEEPEIIKQNGKYGIRLKATAPSIHMMRTEINTEIAPIVGSEQQSEELVMYLLKEFEENPTEIWDSNIFGKSLHSLVNEGMHNKLYRMPDSARDKVRETLERVINEGCSGLICIIL
ncbi:stage IV sporulation protein A [Scatolibacter rhodanostii]|uniref:stage IV sporulation protein A n=1 Tax=Scatolibacter rhodanostii TaxID=2014781 RepID=UPI000C06F6BE|nr:stage IV sporulation protein A [Scatolibacter rhodanostii]